jgi:hypothetical protein
VLSKQLPLKHKTFGTTFTTTHHFSSSCHKTWFDERHPNQQQPRVVYGTARHNDHGCCRVGKNTIGSCTKYTQPTSENAKPYLLLNAGLRCQQLTSRKIVQVTGKFPTSGTTCINWQSCVDEIEGAEKKKLRESVVRTPACPSLYPQRPPMPQYYSATVQV